MVPPNKVVFPSLTFMLSRSILPGVRQAAESSSSNSEYDVVLRNSPLLPCCCGLPRSVRIPHTTTNLTPPSFPVGFVISHVSPGLTALLVAGRRLCAYQVASSPPSRFIAGPPTQEDPHSFESQRPPMLRNPRDSPVALSVR